MERITTLFQPRRALGRTGFDVTALRIGDLADRSQPLETCVATLRRALDAGLNLVDTAPNYEDGHSEQIVGEALRGRREGVFLIDKVDQLEEPVGPQVDTSLARLGLEHRGQPRRRRRGPRADGVPGPPLMMQRGEHPMQPLDTSAIRRACSRFLTHHYPVTPRDALADLAAWADPELEGDRYGAGPLLA